MIDTLVAIAIAIVGQTEGKAGTIAQAAKAAIATVRIVRRPVVRQPVVQQPPVQPRRKYVGCGAAKLAKVEADAEFANRVLVWPDSIDQELVAREMLAAALSQKRAVLAVCAPSTVIRPRPNPARKESPYQEDPFDEDRTDRRSADIDLDTTTMRVDGKVVPARELVDAIRAMSDEIEELRRQLRELKEAKK
jgi:hypothetical protein